MSRGILASGALVGAAALTNAVPIKMGVRHGQFRQVDLPKRDREAAARRWGEWWESVGRQRFQRRARAYERGRATAILPGRESQ